MVQVTGARPLLGGVQGWVQGRPARYKFGEFLTRSLSPSDGKRVSVGRVRGSFAIRLYTCSSAIESKLKQDSGLRDLSEQSSSVRPGRGGNVAWYPAEPIISQQRERGGFNTLNRPSQLIAGLQFNPGIP